MRLYIIAFEVAAFYCKVFSRELKWQKSVCKGVFWLSANLMELVPGLESFLIETNVIRALLRFLRRAQFGSFTVYAAARGSATVTISRHLHHVQLFAPVLEHKNAFSRRILLGLVEIRDRCRKVLKLCWRKFMERSVTGLCFNGLKSLNEQFCRWLEPNVEIACEIRLFQHETEGQINLFSLYVT